MQGIVRGIDDERSPFKNERGTGLDAFVAFFIGRRGCRTSARTEIPAWIRPCGFGDRGASAAADDTVAAPRDRERCLRLNAVVSGLDGEGAAV